MNLDNVILHHAVSAFLSYEAALLDRREFRAWFDLFEDDGLYWIPSSAEQTDMKNQVSIMLEDKALLNMRVTRLAHPHAYSVEPHPATTHLVGNITVVQEGELVIANSKLIVEELREDVSTRWSGTVQHQLRRRGDGFGIVLKRIDVIQAGGVLPAVTIPL